MNTDKDIQRIITYFKARDEVASLYIFGSFASERADKRSDIDIAVLVDEAKLKKTNYSLLRKLYYTASAGFSLRPVDIVILNTASPFLRHQVLKKGRLLFDRNQTLRVRFTTKAVIEYLDFKPAQDVFHKAVADRFRRSNIGR